MSPEEVLVPITFFLSIAVISIIALINRHREKMTIIEKGLSVDTVKALYARKEWRHDPLASLKWGLIFVLAGVSILLGNYLHVQFNVEEGAIIGLVCLFV